MQSTDHANFKILHNARANSHLQRNKKAPVETGACSIKLLIEA